MAKEKENEITPEEYLKKHGRYPAEKLSEQKLSKKSERYGFPISKRKLYDDLHELNPYEKVIYLALQLYADNETNWCNPSMRLLAEKLNLNVDTIQKYIKALKEKRFIRIEIKKGRGGKRFEYWVLK